MNEKRFIEITNELWMMVNKLTIVQARVDNNHETLRVVARSENGKEIDRVRMLIHEDMDTAMDGIIRTEQLKTELLRLTESG
jgi:hypothetical protein